MLPGHGMAHSTSVANQVGFSENIEGKRLLANLGLSVTLEGLTRFADRARQVTYNIGKTKSWTEAKVSTR